MLVNAAEVFATWQIAITLIIVFACLKPNPIEGSGRCSYVIANFFKKALKILLHDTIIRTFLEMFLDLFLSCVIDLDDNSVSNDYERTSAILAAVFLVI